MVRRHLGGVEHVHAVLPGRAAAGYLYAHWLQSQAERRAGRRSCTSSCSRPAWRRCRSCPIRHWKTAAIAQPSLRILALLAVTVGLPYFLLSSTSPLLQAWYARTHKDGLPYRLFALSNFASMLALLSYPLLIEPNLPNRAQGILVGRIRRVRAVCAVTAWRVARSAAAYRGRGRSGRRRRRALLARAAAVAGTCGQRFRPAARRHHAPDAGRRADPVPVDPAADASTC